MSIRLAAKTVLPISNGVMIDVASTGVKHTTPGATAATLGPLAAVRYKTAVYKAHNASDAAVQVTLKLGTEDLAVFSLAAGGATAQAVSIDTVNGEQTITAVMEVTTAGTGTGQVFSFLDIEQPIVVSC
jgi:hypothetical protein